MTDKKPAAQRKSPKRAEHRPRIDAILRAIKEGKYDEELNLLKGAIDDRRTKRQEAVLALVHETFGDEYIVQPKTNVRGVQRSVSSAIHSEEGPPEGWKDTTAQHAPEEGQNGGGGPEVVMTIEGEDEDGFESRSPIIGPVNPG